MSLFINFFSWSHFIDRYMKMSWTTVKQVRSCGENMWFERTHQHAVFMLHRALHWESEGLMITAGGDWFTHFVAAVYSLKLHPLIPGTTDLDVSLLRKSLRTNSNLASIPFVSDLDFVKPFQGCRFIQAITFVWCISCLNKSNRGTTRK